jgi:hypothetical protein
MKPGAEAAGLANNASLTRLKTGLEPVLFSRPDGAIVSRFSFFGRYFVMPGPAEPRGELRAFLAWLQSAEGQIVLDEKYGRVR